MAIVEGADDIKVMEAGVDNPNPGLRQRRTPDHSSNVTATTGDFSNGSGTATPKDDERAQWSSPLQFFFTVLGFCVGLGNIWRFPYLCQKNGGGAFVIPFLIMMVLEGMPLLLLELGIGQKLRRGSYVVWNLIHPNLGGIGLGSTVIAVLVGCYYNMIIAWTIYYLIKTCSATLPWSYCPTVDDTVVVSHGNGTATVMSLVPECEMSSETQYFWYRTTLDISESISDWGGIKWWMFLCLAASWIIVYLICMKGIQSSGYVVYVTALFPYLVLTIFFFRGITLPGAGAGLAHMFQPKLDKLVDPSVWLDAANQVFYSYGLAFGSIIGFGSYNDPRKDCVKDVFLITACNAFTAVYACAVVFSILGFKAQHLYEKCMEHDVAILAASWENLHNASAHDIPEDQYRGIMTSGLLPDNFTAEHGLRNCSLEAELDEAAQGTGLAFIVMADVFTQLPGSQGWSLLFFLMLLALGLGSQIGILEGLMGTMFEMPQLSHLKKPVLSAISCGICFIFGLVFTTGAGEYWLSLFDRYGAMGLTLIAFIEIVSVMYVYGHKRFTDDIQEMTGHRPGPYWQIMWRYVSPALIFVLLVSSLVKELRSTPKYSAWNASEGKAHEVEFPTWSLWVGLLLASSSGIPIAVIALLRSMKIKVLEAPNVYSSVLHRTETSASTAPMMMMSPSTQTFDEAPSPNGPERSRHSSSDSDHGIMVSSEK